jgi:hypothetical protein
MIRQGGLEAAVQVARVISPVCGESEQGRTSLIFPRWARPA